MRGKPQILCHRAFRESYTHRLKRGQGGSGEPGPGHASTDRWSQRMGRQQRLLCRLSLTPSEPVGPQDGAATEDTGVREEKTQIPPREAPHSRGRRSSQCKALVNMVLAI